MVAEAWAASSPIDPSFGVNGQVSTSIADQVQMQGLHGAVLQPDGKAVVAGTAASSSPYGFGIARFNANGEPDREFNGTGQTGAVFGLDAFSSSYAVALQTDGKIVATGVYGFGPNNVVAVARFLPNGALDATFNGNGTVKTALPNTDAAGTAVVVQTDGKIVVAASGTGASALIRYRTDGTLDTTFGSAATGIVFLKALGRAGDISGVSALAQQADGMLVVAGSGHPGAVFTFAVARLTSEGTLDSGFNGTGFVHTSIGVDDRAHALAVQPDGRIVVVGSTRNDTGASAFAVVRYDSNGSLDASFGTDGKVRTFIGLSADSANAVRILPDGRVVVAGTAGDPSIVSFFITYVALVRYTASGALDTTFNGTGRVLDSIPALATYNTGEFLAIQGDGKVLVGGSNNGRGGMLRFLGDGSLDSAFGMSGKVVTSGDSSDQLYALRARADGSLLAAGTSNSTNLAVVSYGADGQLAWSRTFEGDYGARASTVFEQPDGKIVIAGSRSFYGLSVIRLTGDGSSDTTFNGTGHAETGVNGPTSGGAAAALQADGKIVLATTRHDIVSGDDFALVRFNTDGSLDAAFGVEGKVTTDIGALDDRAAALAVQPDGKLLVAGTSFDGTRFRVAVVRYRADGSLDPAFGTGGKGDAGGPRHGQRSARGRDPARRPHRGRREREGHGRSVVRARALRCRRLDGLHVRLRWSRPHGLERRAWKRRRVRDGVARRWKDPGERWRRRPFICARALSSERRSRCHLWNRRAPPGPAGRRPSM
jgi:uncharacterized delta-60 repeat protein